MIEALINPDTGDVIVVKPVGSVWGRCEVNAVVLLDDPELEKELTGQDHVVYPYAAYETPLAVEGVLQPASIVALSLIKIDVATARLTKTASVKGGALRAADADTPRVRAKITDVKALPSPTEAGGVVKGPGRPLPQKTVIVQPILERP